MGHATNVIAMYSSGLSAPQIARRLAMGSTTVYKILDSVGLVRRGATDYTNEFRKKLDMPIAELVKKYESGETISALRLYYGVSFGTIRRNLINAGAVMRKNSSNQFDHLAHQWISMYERDLLSLDAIAISTGVDYATVRRYLLISGVKMRPDSAIQVFAYDSPSAGAIKLRGTWEFAYAQVLDRWFLASAILGWGYETIRIPTSGGIGHNKRHYRPDFTVNGRGGVAYHEVKGYYREKSRKKVEEVRGLGIPIVLVTGRLLSPLCQAYGIPFRA